MTASPRQFLPPMQPEEALDIAIAAGEAETVLRRVYAARSRVRAERFDARDGKRPGPDSFYAGVTAMDAAIFDALDPRQHLDEHPSIRALLRTPPLLDLQTHRAAGEQPVDQVRGDRGACTECGGPTVPPGRTVQDYPTPRPKCANCLWGPIPDPRPAPGRSEPV